MPTTIVFGPTGNIGAAAALSLPSFTTSPIILAMRDTSKSIPSLSPSFESSHPYTRIRADLTDPASLTSAVASTGATHALLYLVPSQDNMRSALEALKEAGIKFIVFISSSSVRDDPQNVKPHDLISYMHAQVELNLEELFGPEGYVALRPGFFNTNASSWWKAGIQKGQVKLFAGGLTVDWISPSDIGRVAAAVLAGKKTGKLVGLLGPENLSFRDGLQVIAKVLGKEVEVVDVDAEEAVKNFLEIGLPEFVAKHLVESFGEGEKKWGDLGARAFVSGEESYETAVGNVEKLTGKKSLRLEEWVEENKGLFSQ
ncbi:hypothetical protein OQA88_3490 [Cercophora sp. LCS_1]